MGVGTCCACMLGGRGVQVTDCIRVKMGPGHRLHQGENGSRSQIASG